MSHCVIPPRISIDVPRPSNHPSVLDPLPDDFAVTVLTSHEITSVLNPTRLLRGNALVHVWLLKLILRRIGHASQGAIHCSSTNGLTSTPCNSVRERSPYATPCRRACHCTSCDCSCDAAFNGSTDSYSPESSQNQWIGLSGDH
jgi:hypothetical protein